MNNDSRVMKSDRVGEWYVVFGMNRIANENLMIADDEGGEMGGTESRGKVKVLGDWLLIPKNIEIQ